MFNKYLSRLPEIKYLPDYDIRKGYPEYGVKALCYEGAEHNGKASNVFAYIGYPKGNGRHPAIILCHGGLGIAYADWVKKWTDRGYVAIAMSLCGHFPKEEFKGMSATETEESNFSRTEAPNGMHPMSDGYSITGENCWLYQAVANTILAHNLLRCDGRVDRDKIGITGISWGGVITSQVIAYDKRFAFAIPIYGSAHLDKGLGWVADSFKNDEAKRLWSVDGKYEDIEFPVLWLCWNKDACFDILVNRHCADQSKGIFSAVDGMGHSHREGWERQESYRFADSVTGNAQPLVRVIGYTKTKNRAELVLSCDKNIKATLYYLTEPMSYKDGKPDFEWKTKHCVTEGNRVYADISSEICDCYIELAQMIDGAEYITCW